MSVPIQYRSDIDGLRAFAVLSVIIFHINPQWLPGGFLGVDIFFVISGYLITLILIKEVKQTNKINIINFYKRRIKRIVPALLFMLIFTLVFSLLFFTPDDILAVFISSVWSFFSAANIYFLTSVDTGYFATSSNEIPLLHLWSLGVEEQFYLLWPFVIFIVLKFIYSFKLQIFFISILFLGSFIWAQAIIETQHSFAYYMIFTRAWELLAGALVGLFVYSGFKFDKISSDFVAFSSLIVIILSFIFISESDSVPGFASLPIIIATSLLIFSGAFQISYISRFLSLKIFVMIGLVSYSAYLWHWPILSFLHYALIEIDLQVSFFVLLSTFIMATISYFLIESPLRKNNVGTLHVYLFYFIIPAVFLSSITFFIYKSIELKKEFIFPWKELQKINKNNLPASAYSFNCQEALFSPIIYTADRCVYPMYSNDVDAFLIGDSNAAHYLGMLQVLSNTYGFSIRNATQSACPMVFDNNFEWIMSRYQIGCSIYTHSLLDEAKKYNTIFVGGAWDFYYPKKGFEDSFSKSVEKLSQSVKLVVLLAKVPYFRNFNKECETRSLRFNSLECSKHFEQPQGMIKSNKFLRNLADQYDNVVYFDIQNQLCSNNKCSPYVDGVPVYFNSNHLSMKGSEFLGERMLETQDSMLEVFQNLGNPEKIHRTTIKIEFQKDIVKFIVAPKSKKVNMAFYLYKDDKRIDTQWYSKRFSYTLKKEKYSAGTYRVRYFIVDENIKKPGKEKRIEQGFSKYIEI